MGGHYVAGAEGEVADLGVARMRLVLREEDTNGLLSVAEFRGSDGPWTVPHVHEHMEESFYVLEGNFSFTVAGRQIDAAQGDFVMVPRGTPHVIHAGSGGGALLALFTPGGLERMFLELGGLPADSITDPKVRAEISSRHDSKPVV